MAYIAFRYNVDSFSSLKESFCGYFNYKDDIFETIQGERWGERWLEIIDLDTNGISMYRWVPHYEYKQEYVIDEKGNHKLGSDGCVERKYYLKYKYNKDAEWFEINEPSNSADSKFGEDDAKFYYGAWNKGR